MEKCEHERRTQATIAKDFALCYAPDFAQISNKNGMAKIFANGKAVCGVRYMPRRWWTLAETKIPAVHRQNGGMSREASEGTSERVSWTLLAA